MKFSVQLLDGSFQGRIAVIETVRFEVGMKLQLTQNESYVVLDGPIARVLQESQESSDVLTVRAKLSV